MKKLSKKILSVLLIIAMLVPTLSLMVTAGAEIENDGIVEFNGHYYKVFDKKMYWTDAKDYCESLGGYLVTITSSSEQSFITELIKNTGFNVCWIGLTTENLTPKWVTGEKYEFSNWAGDNPDNSVSDEYYVHIYAKDHINYDQVWQNLGQWNDVRNDMTSGEGYDAEFYNLEKCGFVCEWNSEKDADLGETDISNSLIPDDAVMFNGHYYKAYDISKSWTNAKRYCEDLGGHLVTINSQSEQIFIEDKFLSSFPKMWYYMIGGYANDTNESLWFWVTGESFNFENWMSPVEATQNIKGQRYIWAISSSAPDGYVDLGVDNKLLPDYKWFSHEDEAYDAVFNTKYTGFICEWDAEEVVFDYFGWPILNTKDSFGYDKNYYRIDLSYYYQSIKSLNLYTGFASISGLDDWAGSCFGLALLAVADYNGQIDLSSYFGKSGKSLNEFGYETIGVVSTKDGTNGNAYIISGNDAVIELIERAQVSQFSYNVEEAEVFGFGYSLKSFISHCKNNSTPLLISMIPELHAVSTDPTRPIEELEDGKYKIWLYDSNAPRISKKIDDQHPVYNRDQSYLLVDLDKDQWAYCYNGSLSNWYDKFSTEYGNIGHLFKTIKFFDISKLDSSFFFSDLKLIDDSVVIDMSELCSLKIENMDELVFALTREGYQINNDFIDYMPYINGSNENNDSIFGCIKLPSGKYTFTTDNEANFSRFISDDYILHFSSKDGLSVDFDDENREVKVINTNNSTVSFEIGVENINNNSADIVSGEIEPNKEVFIKYDSINDSCKNNVTTSSDLSKIKTTYIKDGETVDSQYHKCSYEETGHLKSNWIIDQKATCMTEGLKHIECTECKETVLAGTIPATGHSDANHDGICEVCADDFSKGCSCNCHGNAFMQFLHKIVSFLRKLFGMTQYQYCDCGKAHW